MTEAPFIWHFRDKALLKHNIETKVYDKQGNMNSSGEMTFYMINPFKPDKNQSDILTQETGEITTKMEENQE